MKSGFTLIELLIVMAVIAALLATVTPVATNAVIKAKATQVAMNMRNIKAAVEQCVMVEESTSTKCTTIAGLVNDGYLSSNPNKSGEDYKIGEVTSDGIITVWVGYKGDMKASRIFQVYDEVITSGCDDHFNDDGYKVCLPVRVGKYW